MKFYYPAVFKEEKGMYNVTFPDFTEVEVKQESLEQAMSMAKKSLGKMLEVQFNNHEELPERSAPASIQCDSNAFIMMIEFDSHELNHKKDVSKNVTISSWLAELAEEKNIDISNVLQNALTKMLFTRV